MTICCLPPSRPDVDVILLGWLRRWSNLIHLLITHSRTCFSGTFHIDIIINRVQALEPFSFRISLQSISTSFQFNHFPTLEAILTWIIAPFFFKKDFTFMQGLQKIENCSVYYRIPKESTKLPSVKHKKPTVYRLSYNLEIHYFSRLKPLIKLNQYAAHQ